MLERSEPSMKVEIHFWQQKFEILFSRRDFFMAMKNPVFGFVSYWPQCRVLDPSWTQCRSGTLIPSVLNPGVGWWILCYLNWWPGHAEQLQPGPHLSPLPSTESLRLFVFLMSALCSVVDQDPEPDPKGSEPFCVIRIRIRIIGWDPDLEPKGSEYKIYWIKLDFSCFKTKILSSIHILTLKLLEGRTKYHIYHFHNG